MVLEIFLDVSRKLSGYVVSSFYLMIGISVFVSDSVLRYVDLPGKYLLKSSNDAIRNFLLMFFGVERLDPISYDEEAVKRGNDYVDKLLNEMFDDKSGLDLYVLEDGVVDFSKEVLSVNVNGEAKLYDGSIVGLSTLHREGYCTLQDMGRNIKVRANLGAGDLEFYYKGSVKFMHIGPTVNVEGSLAFIEIEMEFLFDRITGKNGRLTKFAIVDMRGMKVKVSGLGPLNWAVTPIVNGITMILTRFVKNLMGNEVEKHLRKRIPDYQFPVVDDKKTEAPAANSEMKSPKTSPSRGETSSIGSYYEAREPELARLENEPAEDCPQYVFEHEK